MQSYPVSNRQMMALAPIASASNLNTETESEQIHYKNLRNRDELFLLWQKALPGLLSQQFTHHIDSQGISNIKGEAYEELFECLYLLRGSAQALFFLAGQGSVL